VVLCDQRECFHVARAQRKVNQVDQETSCENSGELKSFVDGIFEIPAHLVKRFPLAAADRRSGSFHRKKFALAHRII
jgi:hypothetical protein